VKQRIRVLDELGEGFERAVASQPSRRRHPSTMIVPTVAVIVAAAVVVGVVLLLHPTTRHDHHPATQPATQANASRRELIKILGVLRRPQTAADRAFARRVEQIDDGPIGHRQGTPDLPLVRYATTTPWGQRVYLVPFKPLTRTGLAKLKHRYPNLPAEFFRGASTHEETVSVVAGGSSAGDSTPAQLESNALEMISGAGRSFAGGSTKERLIQVVPDGVVKVEFVFPRQPDGAQHGQKIYSHVLKVTVPVHNNVAAVEVNRECCGTGETIWYAADGHVVKRFGSFRRADHVVAAPKPGPQTPQSRAAERDPSTPNHVWVTPTAGGPHTQFKVHFRVLLNGADYRYQVSGTDCPQFTFPGGTGKPNALRGDLWSDSLSAVQGQALCPGTYHVTVAVMDRGRFGNLKQPVRPFGSASFTVR
jgi:hypothetical protein